MRRPFVPALAALWASGLAAQTNLPPVAQTPLPALTVKPGTEATQIYGLGNYFRDPEVAIVIRTTLGDIPVTLFSDDTVAATVENFLAYVDAHRYAHAFIHRSARLTPQNGLGGIQGGGYALVQGATEAVVTNRPIVLQAGFSNLRGTIAMARLASPDSATSQWFINTVHNTHLDTLGGGYAVFGRISTESGLAVADAISALPILDGDPSRKPGYPFHELPVRNYTAGKVERAHLIFAPISRTIRPFRGFTVSSDEPGIVRPTVAGDALSLAFPGASGTARLKVEATDADGVTGGANAFDVTVSATAPVSSLTNLSTRGYVGPEDEALIGGFVVRGAAKRLLIRSLGPSLTASGVHGALADPNLSLLSEGMVVAGNDNWKETQQAEIQATGFAPTNDQESALVVTLEPGSYTPIVRGTGGATGVATVEVYELSAKESPQLVNLSTRGRVGTGDKVLIGGFVVGGTTPKKVLVRAAGPSLARFAVRGELANPVLELQAAGRVIANNDDYRVQPDGTPNPDLGEIVASGFAPGDPHECAIVATLVPGAYTAIVRGANGAEGVALIEVFDLD